jgi:hypothetical protein
VLATPKIMQCIAAETLLYAAQRAAQSLLHVHCMLVVLAPSLLNLDCLAPGVRERVGGTCSVLTRVGGRADVLHYAAYDASNGTVVVGAVHSLNASQAAITSQATAGRLAAPSPPFAGDRDIATPSSPPLSPPPSPTLPSSPSPGVPPVLVSAAAGPDALSLASDTSPPPSIPITTPPPSVSITTPPPVVIALRDEDVFSDDGKTDASETEEEEAAEKDSASSMLRVCVVPLLAVVAASFALSS